VQVSVLAHRTTTGVSPFTSRSHKESQAGERMDWVVQRAELGVSRIAPLFHGAHMVRLDEKASREEVQHWRAIASRRASKRVARVPEIETPTSLMRCSNSAQRAGPRYFCHRVRRCGLRMFGPRAGATVF